MRGRASAAVRRLAPIGVCAAVCLLLAQCSSSGRIDPRYGVAASPRVVDPGEPVPKGGGVDRLGAPYVVGGRVYVPEQDPHYQAVGLASWYGDDFHGRYTANGEIFDLNGISAAHPTLPLPSYVRVTNLANGRSLIVRVNDRGPYTGNRIIDVSVEGSAAFGFLQSRHRHGARRICRARADRGVRRPHPGGDLAAERARAGSRKHQARLNKDCSGFPSHSPRRCAIPASRVPRPMPHCPARRGAGHVICRPAKRPGRHRAVPQRPRALLIRAFTLRRLQKPP